MTVEPLEPIYWGQLSGTSTRTKLVPRGIIYAFGLRSDSPSDPGGVCLSGLLQGFWKTQTSPAFEVGREISVEGSESLTGQIGK